MFLDDDSDLFNFPIRYRPEKLQNLCSKTKFTRKEIQLMYRGFKQVRIIKNIIIFNVILINLNNFRNVLVELLMKKLSNIFSHNFFRKEVKILKKVF